LKYFCRKLQKITLRKLYNGIKNFSHFAHQTNVFRIRKISLKSCEKLITMREPSPAPSVTIKNFKYFKNDADQVQNDADPTIFNQTVIGAIKEVLRGQLTSIASKLLNSEHSKLDDLSVEEQNLRKSFDNSDIYEFIQLD